ncbi:hypothetical protein GCM10010413_51920 [Promicromonospora sukumoe]
MSRINRPTRRWLLIPVSDAGHPGIRYAAIAPGCDYQPHDSTRCGCRRFDDETDAERYIRDQRRR